RPVPTVDAPGRAGGVDGADELGRSAPVQAIATAVRSGHVDGDPVVLLAAEHIGRALGVLAEASGSEVELDGSWSDLCIRARRVRVTGARRCRCLAVVLVGLVAAGVRQVLQVERGVLLREQACRRWAAREALRLNLIVRWHAVGKADVRV